MSPRLASAASFLAFALAGGILQVLATLLLGLASIDALQRAALEGSRLYLLGALTAAMGLLTAWFLRRRPVVATTTFVGFQAIVLWPLSRNMTLVGLAFHGEYILHHFVALMCAATCLVLVLAWRERAELGPVRWGAAGLVGLGTVCLLGAQILAEPGVPGTAPAWLVPVGTVTGFAGCLVAIAVAWRRTSKRRHRVVAIALLVPFLLRLGLAGPEGLSGGFVPDALRSVLLASVFAAATIAFALFRPALTRGVQLIVVTLAGIGTGVLYVVYRRGFGELEDGIGGLAQSLFGFSLPYPSYVPTWKIFAVMLALFFIFSTSYAGILSVRERVRGMALGLLAVTGIGLTNPQLVSMAIAGLFVFTHSLLEDDPGTSFRPPPRPIESTFATVARELGLPAPVVLETTLGTVMAIRGDVGGHAIDLRARPLRDGGWDVTARLGVQGRGRPLAELVPDLGTGGQRPPHPIGQTHRVRGSQRTFERAEDLLDVLVEFPDARLAAWPGGTVLSLGEDLSALDSTRVVALLRALARRLT